MTEASLVQHVSYLLHL